MTDLDRLRVLTYLVKHAPSGWVGRTALVKFCYLLQIVGGVPLGYRFTLYSYGPFDSNVLADLGNAESLGLVESTYERYPSGYGYRIESPMSLKDIETFTETVVSVYGKELDRVLNQFGGRSAAQLELDTTTVFVQRKLSASETSPSTDEIARDVHEVKPHFSQAEIRTRTQELRELGVI